MTQSTLILIPLRLPSLANCRLHWRKMDRLKASQKKAVYYCLLGRDLPPLPATVTITRQGPQKLDGDNLQGSAKYVRDQVAKAYGVDDGGSEIIWKYAQTHGKEYMVEILIETRKDL